jgi:crotonobetainyl-CoA:carnitine CoA-transferase CaiB-like acyl-CoA transferase
MSGPQPLQGTRVLDLSRVLAGPWSGQLLADYGADVIKVERPGAGDDTRAWGPPWWGDSQQRMAAYYLSANRGKRSIAIDLKQAAGREILLRWVEKADALIEGFRPGVLDRLGLGWNTLHDRNPKLVLCSLSGYGQTGPLAQRAGHDINYPR